MAVKINILIHCVLLTVLCASQFAANVHLAGHLHAPAHDHGGEQHAWHPSNAQIVESSSTNELAVECAIYHTYLGLSGGVPTYCKSVVANAKSFIISTAYKQVVTVRPADHHSIRGPPGIS